MKIGKLNLRVNQQIRSSEVRVISSDGKQIGIMKLGDALAKAKEEGLDLVEIAPNANPPVAKIVDLGKFKYELEKRQRKEAKGSKRKGGEVKEVRLSPFIADHDYEVRLNKISDFLNQNNKVRVVVVFTGRQMESKTYGYDLLNKILEKFSGRISVDMQPKFLGRHLAMVISPVKKSKNFSKID